MSENKLTAEQINDCFKKAVLSGALERPKREKEYMQKLLEEGREEELRELIGEIIKRRRIIKEGIARGIKIWKKRRIDKQKEKTEKIIIERQVENAKKNILTTTLVATWISLFVYMLLKFIFENDFSFFAWILFMVSYIWFMAIPKDIK